MTFFETKITKGMQTTKLNVMKSTNVFEVNINSKIKTIKRIIDLLHICRHISVFRGETQAGHYALYS